MPSFNVTEIIGDYNTQQVLLTNIESMLLLPLCWLSYLP
jgi:hypothetical protein